MDDDPIVRLTLKAQLASAGHELFFAASGPEALACVDEVRPEVILLDVMMPGMTGIEACRELKKRTNLGLLPIIMVTALDDKESIVQALEAGADDFVSKPVPGGVLRARVASVLRIRHQYDRLQDMLTLRKRLEHALVHDLRGPLSVVCMMGDILAMRDDIEDLGEEVDALRVASRKLVHMTSNLLLQAKYEARKLVLSRETVGVHALVEESVHHQRMVAQLQNTTLDVQAEAGQVVSVDPHLMGRLIENLVSNALKHSPDGSTITIQARTGVAFELSVIDVGHGIAPAVRERLFEPFVAEQSQDAIGIGLSFCRMVAEAHGATLSVSENQPRGSVFTFRMPL